MVGGSGWWQGSGGWAGGWLRVGREREGCVEGGEWVGRRVGDVCVGRERSGGVSGIGGVRWDREG